MSKKNCNVAHRALNLLRLALLWTRKGGVFKRRLMMDLHLVPKFLKSLGHTTPRDKIHYFERELSFDKTPIFQVKVHRPASMRFLIPCLEPQVDFDYDFDGDNEDAVYGYGYECGRKSFLKGGEEEEKEENGYEDCEEIVPVEEEGIDLRAEEFIAKFYEQMKLQRQISYVEYNEMLNRGTS